LEFDLPPPPPTRFLPDEEKHVQSQKGRQPGRFIAQQQQKQQTNRPLRRRIIQRNKSKRVEEIQATTISIITTTSTQVPTTTTIMTTTQFVTSPSLLKETTKRVSHLLGKNDPNTFFISCCKSKKVDKRCESRCNFDYLNKKILTQMFLGLDPCPPAYGLDLFTCAAQDSDHTPCCRGKNVQRTSAGDKCLQFCDMSPGNRFQADGSHLPCWAVLNEIKTCFKDAIISNNA
jgi:hypothetical protein